MNPIEQGQIQEHLQTMLVPLVRFAMKHALTVQNLGEALKRAFVTVAHSETGSRGSRANVSRISVLTGIHRREVDRLLRDEPTNPSLTASISARVVGHWEQDAHFCTARGSPRSLSVGHDRSEFRELVAKVSKDVNPAAVLFDLERSRIVRRRRDRVSLVRRSYLIREDAQATLGVLSKDCADLIAAVLENIESANSTPHLHARTEYDNLDVSALPRIQAALLDHGSAFHTEMRALLAKHDLDIAPRPGKTGGARVAVITVSYSKSDYRDKEGAGNL